MTQKMHNLDDVAEYFDFILKGNTYRFRQMTMEEIEKLKEIEGDEKKTMSYLFTFISKVTENAPEFATIAKKMVAPQWKKFVEMLKTEFTG